VGGVGVERVRAGADERGKETDSIKGRKVGGVEMGIHEMADEE